MRFTYINFSSHRGDDRMYCALAIIAAVAIGGIAITVMATWTEVDGNLTSCSYIDEWDKEWHVVTVRTDSGSYTTGHWDYTFSRSYTLVIDGDDAGVYHYTWDVDISSWQYTSNDVPSNAPVYSVGMRVQLAGPNWFGNGLDVWTVTVLPTK